MFKAPCPSCGGELKFRSSFSVLAVCPYCRSNVLRYDVNLELIGKQSELLPDMSPLQLGASGRYKRKKFFIVGRQIMGWEDGRWNEWYIIFSDGSDGWIAEAQGEFSVLTKAATQFSLQEEKELKSLDKIKVNDKMYSVIDRKYVTCLGSEGELPFKAIEGSRSMVIDLSTMRNDFASIEIEDEGLIHCFVGKFTTLRKLRIVGGRTFIGWENR